MSELQKNIIEVLLKEKKKTKRELAKVLNIKENSINRLLKSSNITLLKLGVIADFLGVDITDLLPKKESVQEPEEEYQPTNPADVTTQLTINNLSEALNRNSKTIDNLVRIISENYPNRNLPK
ncbi:MAG: helix-turn-helix transcriptional regulator [Candidatus Azobacteroides sp.]|nr:helix-turn-helix transcriptional regulator [Candidatus Azobacteroides sp.]